MTTMRQSAVSGLALTRTDHPGENAVQIGPDAIIRVSWIQGPKVRLLIEAPRDLDIMRPEVLEQMSAEERQEYDQRTHAKRLRYLTHRLDALSGPDLRQVLAACQRLLKPTSAY